MDKLTDYPKLIKRILTEYVELCRHPQADIDGKIKSPIALYADVISLGNLNAIIQD
ncbi:MAG: hypothetical protein WBA89_13860 [Microcoleus sp.]|uniref:hypothetical protein n=1 Tax=Microcoleus sp. TaxID=44472 RepID=UPI003C74871C